jgi:hypothetical protein
MTLLYVGSKDTFATHVLQRFKIAVRCLVDCEDAFLVAFHKVMCGLLPEDNTHDKFILVIGVALPYEKGAIGHIRRLCKHNLCRLRKAVGWEHGVSAAKVGVGEAPRRSSEVPMSVTHCEKERMEEKVLRPSARDVQKRRKAQLASLARARASMHNVKTNE